MNLVLILLSRNTDIPKEMVMTEKKRFIVYLKCFGVKVGKVNRGLLGACACNGRCYLDACMFVDECV